MRFHEPDVRDAYRLGARELYDAVSERMKSQHVRAIEQWLAELDSWDDGEPPATPTIA